MKPVIITTEFRGVFFGYLEGEPKDLPEKVELKNARMCVYWSADMRGVLGLASQGPSKSCRISQAAPSFTAYKVTSVTECSPKAAEQWEAAPWS